MEKRRKWPQGAEGAREEPGCAPAARGGGGGRAGDGAAHRMSPTQEVFNALTMVPLACMALHTLVRPAEGTTSADTLFAAAIIVHFPFSFCYHTHCALRHGLVDPVENNFFLKLDLVFIHISGSLMALATSASYAWFLAMALFNAVSASRTLRWSNTTFERRSCRACCLLGYLLPVFAIDWVLFAWAMVVFGGMAFCFACNQQLRGWGHSLSHILLVPFAACFFAAI